MNDGSMLRYVVQFAAESAASCPELSRLLNELATSLEAQPALRQNVVLGLLFLAFEAFDEEEDSCGRLLLQVAVLLAAVREETAISLLQETVEFAKADLSLLTN